MSDYPCLRGEGRDVAVPQQASYLYVALGVRAGVEVPLIEHWSLQALVDVTLSPTPAAFHVNGLTAWETPLLAGAGRLGLLVSF